MARDVLLHDEDAAGRLRCRCLQDHQISEGPEPPSFPRTETERSGVSVVHRIPPTVLHRSTAIGRCDDASVPLLDHADSLLIVVDAQPGFSGDAGADHRTAVHSREVAAWLVGVAAALSVPIVVTEEDAASNGPTDPVIADRLPAGTPVLAKSTFGLTGEPAILVGAETDVCVAQSAIGLLDLGFRVVVVADATFSPGAMHDHGLAHVQAAGGEVRHAKGVYYDWVRTLAAARAFQEAHPDLASPPGFAL
jgi:nicotinamidase-related amidase